jgi:predicted hotdog family 3-hydroxylacyl-ACP dehydratase
MKATREEIARLIPHQGSMCLLDAVQSWNEAAIECTTATHRGAGNPLRAGGELAAVHLVEYGAQAMAVHGGLLARAQGGVAAPGLLVAVRDVQLAVARIDDVGGDLTVRAKKLVANAGGWLYSFEVDAGDKRLASGRVSVIPA